MFAGFWPFIFHEIESAVAIAVFIFKAFGLALAAFFRAYRVKHSLRQ
jgi:hypothetical protein